MAISWFYLPGLRTALGSLFYALAWAPMPASVAAPASRRVERAPVDTAHWLPNMPRGHEERLRGGVRVTNADVTG